MSLEWWRINGKDFFTGKFFEDQTFFDCVNQACNSELFLSIKLIFLLFSIKKTKLKSTKSKGTV